MSEKNNYNNNHKKIKGHKVMFVLHFSLQRPLQAMHLPAQS